MENKKKGKKVLIILMVIFAICIVGVLLSPNTKEIKPIYPLGNLFEPESVECDTDVIYLGDSLQNKYCILNESQVEEGEVVSIEKILKLGIVD